MTEPPASALRARDLDGAFQTVDAEGFPQAPPSDYNFYTMQQTETLSNKKPGAYKGKEIKVYAPHTALSAETSYVHDYPEHPLEARCVNAGGGGGGGWWTGRSIARRLPFGKRICFLINRFFCCWF
jgi:hypothetical protein